MTDEAGDEGWHVTVVAFRSLCLDCASEFATAARDVVASEGPPRLAYHLALLCLEEIGKGEIVVASAITAPSRAVGTSGWVNRLLDSHEGKLHWALWSPMLDSKADPAQFVRSREMAERFHQKRLGSLYAQPPSRGEPLSDPRTQVTEEETVGLLELAESRLRVARATDLSAEWESEDLSWFLSSTSDPEDSKRVINPATMKLYEEVGGDVRAWLSGVRSKLKAEDEELDRALRDEMARVPTPEDLSRPRWQIVSRIYAASHTFRPKPFRHWNERMSGRIELRVSKKTELLVTVNLSDIVVGAQVFDAGLSMTKLFLAVLNIGAMGFFWFDLPSQERRYYERIDDLANPGKSLVAERKGIGDVLRQGVLDEDGMERTIRCFVFMLELGEAKAATVFGPYLQGLTLTAKNDIHIGTEEPARAEYLEAVRGIATLSFGWDEKQETLRDALWRILATSTPDEAHRTQLLEVLDAPTGSRDRRLEASLYTKLLADLLINLAADQAFKARLAKLT